MFLEEILRQRHKWKTSYITGSMWPKKFSFLVGLKGVERREEIEERTLDR